MSRRALSLHQTLHRTLAPVFVRIQFKRLLALSLFFIATPAWSQTPAPPEPEQPPSSVPLTTSDASTRVDVQLVYTGRSMGIGSGSYQFNLPKTLAALWGRTGGKLTHLEPFHGCLVQGPYALFTKDGTVRAIRSFLEATPISCQDPQPALARTTDHEVLLIPGALASRPWLDAPEIKETGIMQVQRRVCQNAKGAKALLYGPAFDGNQPKSWDLKRFEFRLGLRLQLNDKEGDHQLYAIGRPHQEGTRRFQLLSKQANATKQTVYVDAGSFVDGASSVRDGALSLHRGLGFRMLKSLSPAALVPAQTELTPGPRAFLAEARTTGLTYIAANWKTKHDDLRLKSFTIREIKTEHGPVRIAFIGIVDPALVRFSPLFKKDGVEISDPVDAVTQTLHALKSEHIDTIVVLTTADSNVLQDLQSIDGVDLVIGDSHAQTARVDEVTVAVNQKLSGRRPSLFTFPVNGITSAKLSFKRNGARWALAQVALKPHRVEVDSPTDPDMLGEITQTRAQVYPQYERSLEPTLENVAPAVLRGSKWDRLVCEAVLRYTQADVVLLNELPVPMDIPGPLTELMLVDRLALLDRLEEHVIPGDRLADLLYNLGTVVPIGCGGQLGVKKPKIHGRSVDPDRSYRIISTDRTRAALLEPFTKGAYSTFLMDDQRSPVQDAVGQHLTLRMAVLKELRNARRDANPGTSPLTPYLQKSEAKKTPMWMFKVKRLSARFERFKGSNNSDFSSIPETQATNPNTISVGGDLDVTLVYHGLQLLWDMRGKATFNRYSVDGATPEELADDLRASSAVSFPGLDLSLGGPGSFTIMPFLETLLDSEFTPGVGSDGPLPRQLDLLVELGFASRPMGMLRFLRLGGFTGQDLSQSNKSLDYGMRLEAQTLQHFAKRLRWTTSWDITVYGDTADDDAGDLRFKAQVEGRLSLPLARFLDVSLFGQAFVFQGRIEQTSDIGVAYTLGFSLDLRANWPF